MSYLSFEYIQSYNENFQTFKDQVKENFKNGGGFGKAQISNTFYLSKCYDIQKAEKELTNCYTNFQTKNKLRAAPTTSTGNHANDIIRNYNHASNWKHRDEEAQSLGFKMTHTVTANWPLHNSNGAMVNIIVTFDTDKVYSVKGIFRTPNDEIKRMEISGAKEILMKYKK